MSAAISADEAAALEAGALMAKAVAGLRREWKRGEAARRREDLHDPQRWRCYAWERAIRPPEEQPSAISVRKPFTPEFLRFFVDAWDYGFGLYGNSKVKKWPNMVAADRPPRLRFSIRLRRASGTAGFSFGRDDRLRPTITIGSMGMTRHTLLHELAHVLTAGDGHGPDFCRVALDLYVKFLSVDEAQALKLADEYGVKIA
jgi:hypothetical protein